MKGYPLALVLLGVRERRYGETTLAIALAVLLTFLALTQFDSGVVASWHGFQKGQAGFWHDNIIGSASLFGTSDPYNGLRALAWIGLHAKQQFLSGAPTIVADPQHFDPHLHAKFLKSVAGGADLTGPRVLFARAYNGLSTVFAGVSTFYVLFIATSRWRRMTMVALVTILYPILAGDYKLLVLLPGIFTVLMDGENSKARRTAVWLLALMMIPKAYLFFYGLSITMILNPILLLTLWGITIWEPAAWRQGLSGIRARLNWYLRPASHEALS